MQLTRFTDLGLRVLMYLATDTPGAAPATIPELAERFQVSRNHLMKVVHFMGQHGLVHTTRGKGGGLALARPAGELSIGNIVRLLEPGHDLIDCETPPCALHGGCRLKWALQQAEAAFYASLDQVTLADAVSGPTGETLIKLHRLTVG
jgi:Rrf2 family nitric oxide-sensitive transcriptional repressor